MTRGVLVVGMILVHILPSMLSLLPQTTAAGGFGEKFHDQVLSAGQKIKQLTFPLLSGNQKYLSIKSFEEK